MKHISYFHKEQISRERCSQVKKDFFFFFFLRTKDVTVNVTWLTWKIYAFLDEVKEFKQLWGI